MLVLTRKLHEKIVIGDNVVVTVLRTKGNAVRLGIEAPRDVKIVRGELPPKINADETPVQATPEFTLEIDLGEETEAPEEAPGKAPAPLANRVARLFNGSAV